MAEIIAPHEVMCRSVEAEGLPSRLAARLTIQMLEDLRVHGWKFVHEAAPRELVSYRAGAVETEATDGR